MEKEKTGLLVGSCLSGVMNPSIEQVMCEYVTRRQAIEDLKKRGTDDAEKKAIIERCEQLLVQAHEALNPVGWWKRRKVFAAWHLYHRVDEEMVLLMSREELLGKGRKLIGELKISAIPDEMKTDWIVTLTDRLKALQGPADPTIQLESAHQIKIALGVLNDYTDDSFWNLWTGRFLALIYVALLISSGLFLYVQWTPDMEGSLDMPLGIIMLLGAIGGLASGIITGERELLAKGHFWVQTIFYSLARPALGVLAAIIMSWMLQSEYLIKIYVVADPQKSVNEKNVPDHLSQETKAQKTAVAGIMPTKISTTIKKDAAETITGKSNQEKKTVKRPAAYGETMIRLRAPEGREGFLYALVLLIAGFSGDKLLKGISDKMSSRLFAEAEKTRSPK